MCRISSLVGNTTPRYGDPKTSISQWSCIGFNRTDVVASTFSHTLDFLGLRSRIFVEESGLQDSDVKDNFSSTVSTTHVSISLANVTPVYLSLVGSCLRRFPWSTSNRKSVVEEVVWFMDLKGNVLRVWVVV